MTQPLVIPLLALFFDRQLDSLNMKKLVCLFLTLLLVACATKPGTSTPPSTDGQAVAATQTGAVAGPTGGQVGEAVTAPLRTLNLIKPDVAAALRSAAEAPYALPQPLTCDAIGAEVVALNTALGADLDAVASNTSASLADRGTEAANKAAIGALRNAADGLVPYGGLVRQLSGANRAAKEAADARAAGVVRRAYLKGLGQAMKCETPAAPLSEGRAPPKPKEEPVDASATPTSEP
jgi:hypothetical protein